MKTNISTRKQKASQPGSVSTKKSNTPTDVLESRDNSLTLEENTPDTSAVSSTGLNMSKGCMCFSNFEDDVLDGCGADWLDCACGQWLHCDCVEDCMTDRYGKSDIVPI